MRRRLLLCMFVILAMNLKPLHALRYFVNAVGLQESAAATLLVTRRSGESSVTTILAYAIGLSMK